MFMGWLVPRLLLLNGPCKFRKRWRLFIFNFGRSYISMQVGRAITAHTSGQVVGRSRLLSVTNQGAHPSKALSC